MSEEYQTSASSHKDEIVSLIELAEKKYFDEIHKIVLKNILDLNNNKKKEVWREK